jgi:hypothetical protein
MPEGYDSSRMANYGRDLTQTYGRFLKARDRLVKEISAGLDSGTSSLKIAHDLLGRCKDREEMINLLSVLDVLAQQGDIPQTIMGPFREGIRPRRV